MLNNRKLAFAVSALVVAGFSITGCEPADPCFGSDQCKSSIIDDNDNNGGGSNTIESVMQYTASQISKADSACKASNCMSASKCLTGADHAACLCAENGGNNAACHTYPMCNGIGECKQDCGVIAGSCGWPVCAKSAACSSESVLKSLASVAGGMSYLECRNDDACKAQADLCEQVAAMNPAADFDMDGIANDKEMMGTYSHPCFSDSDGDGLSDGDEVGADGILDEAAGETDPMVSNTTDPEIKLLRSQVCKLIGGEDSQFTDFSVAQIKGAKYVDGGQSSNAVMFSDSKHKVVGFFGAGQSKTADQILKAAGLVDGSYVGESNFTSSMPMAEWASKGYKPELQILPGTEVNRMKFSLTLDGQKLEDVAKQIAGVFGLKSVSLDTSTSCDGPAILYFARSTYVDDNNKKFRLYSGAMTCASTRGGTSDTDIEAMNIMDDVLSGTLVAPKNGSKFADAKNTNGYVPYKQNYCQTSQIGNASGMVDFVWVIDNSGSMADELDNITNTASIFAQRLATSGIDYRIAVTTTDAYVIDEPGMIDYVSSSGYDYARAYAVVEQGKPTGGNYMNAIGIRMGTSANQASAVVGFIDVARQVYNNGQATTFSKSISSDKLCNSGQKNICGVGIEDGFKSGAFTLSRLAIKHDMDVTDIEHNGYNLLSKEDQAQFAEIVDIKNKIAEGEFSDVKVASGFDTVKNHTRIKLRDEALKYIIWVSDEDSRQFKEESGLTTCSGSDCEKTCMTGFKVEDDGTMRTGKLSASDTAAACSPTMTSFNKAVSDNLQAVINDESGNTTLIENYSIDEIKADSNLADYTKVLSYYLKEYRKFAGTGGIAGFAIVGDKGNRNGGSCKNLKVCDGICFKDANDKVGEQTTKGVGCFDCNGTWKDDPAATIGANYAVPYIHLARFVSLDEKGEGKEGGYSSICSDNFDTAINSIFEDVSGRVASHTLETLPISTSIRVAIVKKGKTQIVTLNRGQQKHGFAYDASQNAIVFTGVTDLNLTKDDYFVITYDIWKGAEG